MLEIMLHMVAGEDECHNGKHANIFNSAHAALSLALTSSTTDEYELGREAELIMAACEPRPTV